MRRKLITYTLLATVAGAVLWACQRDRFGHDNPNAVEPTLTVNEARDFFEYQMSEAMPYLTRVSSDRPTGMMPGDFTPLWDKARIGANPALDGADVPIDPKFIFTAIFNRVTPDGDTVRHVVDVTQKLVVKKWRGSSDYKAYSYIASIVPTPEHYAMHKNIGKEFQYAGGKGDFSGFVIYRTLTGQLVAIDNFRDGQPTRNNYFPCITTQNADSVACVAEQAMETAKFQGGTPAMYMAHTEEDDPWISNDVTIVGPKPNPFPERPTGLPEPLPNPTDRPGGGGGGGGGTGGGNGNTGNTGNTPSVSTMFNATNLTESEKAEINSYLSRLSELGMSKKVLTELMSKGKIKLVSGTVPGHENSQGVYNRSENTITLNMEILNVDGPRNAIIEETFHAYQFGLYDNPNQRCMEFEAKVYGTVIINMFEGNNSVFDILNPMVSNVDHNTRYNFGLDVKRMSGNFTHGISNKDMNTLYQKYGGHCTQYPAGDPNWEFKAMENAQK